MAKKSKRLTVRYEKDQSGCMWGLISLFDFRHARSSRKLLSDSRKRVSKHPVGDENSINKFEILANLDEDCVGALESEECKTLDILKPSVKKLIEEEMLNEEDAKKTEWGHSEHFKKDQKKMRKCYKKSCDMDADSLIAGENLKEQTLNDLPLDVMLKEIYWQIHRKSTSEMKPGQDDRADLQSNGCLADLEEKVVEAVKEYLGPKFNVGKNFTEIEKIQHSREIMDALRIPRSEEEVFLELSQDPDSTLLKYIRRLHSVLLEKVEEPKSHEFNEVRKSEELVDDKQRMFFGKKVKHRRRELSKENKNTDASSKIVILKPGPKSLLNSEADNVHPSAQKSSADDKRKVSSERVGSNFFLAEIKRKFKHAIGKDQHEVSTNKNATRNSTSKDHFYMERIARPPVDGKRGEKTGKLDSEISQDFENVNNTRRGPSNIYVEAKKHLSEMFSSGDESVDFLSGRVPKTLGRILSLPEYNFSPISSPRNDIKLSSITTDMRSPPACSRLSNGNETMLSPKEKNNSNPVIPVKGRLCVPDDSPDIMQPPKDNHFSYEDLIYQDMVEDDASLCKDELTSEGHIEILKISEIAVSNGSSILDSPMDTSCLSPYREGQIGEIADACDEKRVSDVSSVPIASSSPVRADQNGDAPDMGKDNDEQPFKCSTQGSSEENQLPSSLSMSPSSSSAVGKDAGESEGGSDVPERPSPISVLEPLFVEDNLSPMHGMPLAAGLPLQPVRILFDDSDHAETDRANITKTAKEDKEVIFDYVRAVLLASGFNWNEIGVKWLSSEQFLDSLLSDEVELFPNRLCPDRKLLFDCINEVLVDICQSYPPWLSFVKPCLRSILDLEEDISEVCEGVYWHLLPMPQPLTLDHLVKKDMSRTRAWMNLHPETETIGIDTCEAIFEDLVEDAILSCVHDSSDSDEKLHTENENTSAYS